jgi:hypothetical protein
MPEFVQVKTAIFDLSMIPGNQLSGMYRDLTRTVAKGHDLNILRSDQNPVAKGHDLNILRV